MARSRPLWALTGALTTTPSVIHLPDNWREIKISVDALCYGQLGAAYAAPAVGATNGITTISSGGTPTGGTFRVRAYPGDSDLTALTSALPYNESAANVKTAMVATGLFASGDITAAGGALPTDITLTWTGVYAATVPPIEIVSAVTGGSNSRIYTRTTTVPDGNGGYGYLAANTQEVWASDGFGSKVDRFLYLATVSGAATFYLTAYW